MRGRRATTQGRPYKEGVRMDVCIGPYKDGVRIDVGIGLYKDGVRIDVGIGPYEVSCHNPAF